MRKPWFRAANQTWYYFDPAKRQQIPLRDEHGVPLDKAGALAKWHAMQAVSRPDAPDAPLVSIFDAYLSHLKKNVAKSTFELRKRYIIAFSEECGHIPPSELKKFHLTEWLDAQDFRTGARRGAINAIKAALNWADEQDLINGNPLARFKAPPSGRREVLVSEADQRRIIERTDSQFRMVALALAHTGCREIEVRTVDAKKFDEQAATWIFPPDQHKTGKKTGRKRVIHLTPCMVTLSRILANARPTGPMFLNRRGRPWTCNAVRCRMRRLRKALDLPAGTVAYSFRHTFTTDGMVRGVDSATMAELLGHRDTSMIDKHYGHLDQRAEHLRESLAKARAVKSAGKRRKTG